MTTIYITEANRPTRYDTVTLDMRELAVRTRTGGSNTAKAMQAILDDACVNTNDTFAEQGKTEVGLEQWNKEFTRNVEFLMATGEHDSVAVGNLKHYGFRP